MKKFNKTSKFFILITVILALTVMFSSAAFAADADVIKNYGADSTEVYCEYRWNITTINFVDSFDGINDEKVLKSWELTDNIKACISVTEPNEETSPVPEHELRYDLYIASEADIKAPADMSYFFANYKNVEKIVGLNKLDTSSVTDMEGMFADCTNLKTLDLSGINTENVTDMSYMFKDCKSLEEVTLSGFNTEKVTLMKHMFSGCKSLYELRLGSFNTKGVIDTQYMFADCEELHRIYVGNDWIFLKATSSNGMFENCYNLAGKTAYDPVKLDVKYASTEYYTVHESVLNGVPLTLTFTDTLTVGQKEQAFNYTGYYYYSFIESYKSLNPDIVKVNDKGEFEAVGAGRAEITTTLKNKEGTITFIFHVEEIDKQEKPKEEGLLSDFLKIFKHWFQRLIDLFTGKFKIF